MDSRIGDVKSILSSNELLVVEWLVGRCFVVVRLIHWSGSWNELQKYEC